MTISLHLPRRHRRPLLFPPGLLALAWLLWLGCVALPSMRGMGPRQVIFQLAVESKPFRNEIIPLPLKDALVFPNSFMFPLELASLRPWKNISFNGNLWSDYFSYQQVSASASELKKHNDRDLGMRVGFAAPASYCSLIYTLNNLSTADPIAKRVNYWLDIRHQPTTVYAITSKPAKSIEYYAGHRVIDIDNALMNCSVLDIPTNASLLSWQDLFHPDWRCSTLLLLLLAVLSATRLYRQHRTG